MEEDLFDVIVINCVYVTDHYDMSNNLVAYYKIGNIYKAKKFKEAIFELPEGDGVNHFTHKVYIEYPSNSYMFTDAEFSIYFRDISEYRNDKINELLDEDV